MRFYRVFLPKMENGLSSTYEMLMMLKLRSDFSSLISISSEKKNTNLHKAPLKNHNEKEPMWVCLGYEKKQAKTDFFF